MKGIILFSNLMEDVEALGTAALLKRAGLELSSATFEDTLELQTAFQQSVKADRFASVEDADHHDFLVIPGGPYVKRSVDDDKWIKTLARRFHEQGKLVAAICAGPRFLGQAGLLANKRFTCFTGSEQDAPDGIHRPEEKAVTDGNIVTARGAGAIYDFAHAIVTWTLGGEQADQLLSDILY